MCYVEGIGDEVLFGLISTLVFIAVVSILYNAQAGPRYIHPLQQEQVQIARDRLGFRGGADNLRNQPANEQDEIPQAPRVNYATDRHCPVCLNEARFLTTTNCGHIFCGKFFESETQKKILCIVSPIGRLLKFMQYLVKKKFLFC